MTFISPRIPCIVSKTGIHPDIIAPVNIWLFTYCIENATIKLDMIVKYLSLCGYLPIEESWATVTGLKICRLCQLHRLPNKCHGPLNAIAEVHLVNPHRRPVCVKYITVLKLTKAPQYYDNTNF